ncbi:ATP-binding protein [Kitasatospora sp. NPDC059571]|uniref:ATP-binding protein n=1 Tax=Kitasatospora sp. NPDC059571 TaxID=3346871 RepID=UPI00367E035C
MLAPTAATPPPCTSAPPGTGEHTVGFEVPATAQMAHLVRGWATALLTAWHLPADDTCSVLAELAANAAEHGGPTMTIRLRHHGDALDVDVTDTGTLPDRVCRRALPGAVADGPAEVLREVPVGALRGRGLHMVAALAEHLRLERQPDGTTRALAVLRLPATLPARP